jgi:hypothetical protein
MTHGDLVEIPFKFLASGAPAWVLIFRPAWADKLVGRYIRITPRRGKVFGSIILLGFVYNTGWTLLFGPSPHLP